MSCQTIKVVPFLIDKSVSIYRLVVIGGLKWNSITFPNGLLLFSYRKTSNTVFSLYTKYNFLFKVTLGNSGLVGVLFLNVFNFLKKKPKKQTKKKAL